MQAILSQTDVWTIIAKLVPFIMTGIVALIGYWIRNGQLEMEKKLVEGRRTEIKEAVSNHAEECQKLNSALFYSLPNGKQDEQFGREMLRRMDNLERKVDDVLKLARENHV